MGNWIVLNRTDYLHKMDLALNNLQGLICHKTQQTKSNLVKCQKQFYFKQLSLAYKTISISSNLV